MSYLIRKKNKDNSKKSINKTDENPVINRENAYYFKENFIIFVY